MGASSSKASTQTYSYSDIAAAALYSVSSTCKASAVSNQQLNITNSVVSNTSISLSAKQRLECLSSVSADSTFDSKFQNSIDNLLKSHASAAVGASKTSTKVKTEIVSQMRQTMESHTSAELFGSTAQIQLVNITNATVTGSSISVQADAFVKVVSEILSKNGISGSVVVNYKTNTDNSSTNAVSDLGDAAAGVLNNAVGVVGNTAGGIVDTAKTVVSGVLDIVGSPFLLIIVAVIVVVLIYLYLKSPTNPVGALGAFGAIGAQPSYTTPPRPIYPMPSSVAPVAPPQPIYPMPSSVAPTAPPQPIYPMPLNNDVLKQINSSSRNLPNKVSLGLQKGAAAATRKASNAVSSRGASNAVSSRETINDDIQALLKRADANAASRGQNPPEYTERAPPGHDEQAPPAYTDPDAPAYTDPDVPEYSEKTPLGHDWKPTPLPPDYKERRDFPPTGDYNRNVIRKSGARGSKITPATQRERFGVDSWNLY